MTAIAVQKLDAGENNLFIRTPWGLHGNENIDAFIASLNSNTIYRFFNKKEHAQRHNKFAPLEHNPEFRFIRKQGIHYVFQAVHGGFIQTMTREQFIGKKIVEVNEDDR